MFVCQYVMTYVLHVIYMKMIQFNSDIINCNKMAGELELNSYAEEKETKGTHIRERFMENEEVIGIIKRVQDICKDWMSLEADLELMTSRLIFLFFKTKGLTNNPLNHRDKYPPLL